MFDRERGLRTKHLALQGLHAGLEGLGHAVSLAGEETVMAPPVEADLLALIDGAGENPDTGVVRGAVMSLDNIIRWLPRVPA